MDQVSQSAASGTDGVIEMDGSLREELEGIQAVGFSGVVASHQEREVVQVVQVNALNALVIADGDTLETQLNNFHHDGLYISVFTASLNGIRVVARQSAFLIDGSSFRVGKDYKRVQDKILCRPVVAIYPRINK